MKVHKWETSIQQSHKPQKFHSNLFCSKPSILTPVRRKCTDTTPRKKKIRATLNWHNDYTILSMFHIYSDIVPHNSADFK